MGGGGSGSSGGSQVEGNGAVPFGNIMYRQWPFEKKQIGSGYDFQNQQFTDFGNQNPNLNSGQNIAQFGMDTFLPQATKAFGGYESQLGDLFGSNKENYQLALNAVNPTIASGGALTPEQMRDVSQQGRTLNEQYDVTPQVGNLANEVLNRDNARQQRLNTAIGQQQGILGGETAAQTGITGQQSGLLGQLQGLQTGAINQGIGVQNAITSNAGGRFDPVLQYLGNLFSGNQQASVQGAQINAQEQAASNASKGSTAGGAISGVGSIIGAVLPMLAAASDERVKTKIKSTGLKTPDNIPIKTFEYLTNPGKRFAGVMAQDVERKRPDQVWSDPLSGLKMVGVEFKPVPVGG